MTSSDAVTIVFHVLLCLLNLLVKRIDLKLCVYLKISKMLCLIIYRVYKMFDWLSGDGFRCCSALCLFIDLSFVSFMGFKRKLNSGFQRQALDIFRDQYPSHNLLRMRSETRRISGIIQPSAPCRTWQLDQSMDLTGTGCCYYSWIYTINKV